MKNIFIIVLSLISITSCSSWQSNGNSESDSKEDTTIISTENSSNKYKDLIGVWWNANDVEASSATFMFTDTSVIYPDQEENSEYKYKVINDMLTIYFEGYESKSKIKKLTSDTLVLITDGKQMTCYKRKEE
jgi:hypothetical protein